MAGPVPDTYIDGCTIGPQKFGLVSHRDICEEHDRLWWEKRNLHNKFRSDWMWSIRIVKRHWSNGPWVLVAILYAVAGFLFLNTLGWWFWWQKR